jgi:hypothetical protein
MVLPIFLWHFLTQTDAPFQGDVFCLCVFDQVIVVLFSLSAIKDLLEKHSEVYADRPTLPIIEMCPSSDVIISHPFAMLTTPWLGFQNGLWLVPGHHEGRNLAWRMKASRSQPLTWCDGVISTNDAGKHPWLSRTASRGSKGIPSSYQSVSYQSSLYCTAINSHAAFRENLSCPSHTVMTQRREMIWWQCRFKPLNCWHTSFCLGGPWWTISRSVQLLWLS